MDKRNKALAGKRIVVTRAPEQAQELSRLLEQMGAEVLLLPTVRFAAPEDCRGLDAALSRLAEFDWVFFTSRNAVGFFTRRLMELRLKLPSPKPRIAAVGPKTAEIFGREEAQVDYIAEHYTGELLVRELRDSLAGRSVLLPRSDRADDRVPAALREAGARVTEVIAYRTTAPDSLDPEIAGRIRRAEVDAILFASPSAFHNLAAVMGDADLAALSARVQFAAMGPTTARALREAGVRVEIEAKESSAGDLADSIAKYYQRQPSTVRSS